jgi:hypothetical protein
MAFVLYRVLRTAELLPHYPINFREKRHRLLVCRPDLRFNNTTDLLTCKPNLRNFLVPSDAIRAAS